MHVKPGLRKQPQIVKGKDEKPSYILLLIWCYIDYIGVIIVENLMQQRDTYFDFKHMNFLTSQYMGTCKSAYTKGYALN